MHFRIALRPRLLMLVVAAPMAAQAQATSTPDTPFLEVAGHGESRIAPDRATVILSVETKGTSAAIVGANNARIQARVLDTLRTLGFTGTQVSTVSYNVAPNHEPTERGMRQSGYIARNAVRVRVTRLDRIGGVIDAALAAGATGVGGVHFEATSTEAAEREAVAQAASNARAEAEALARALGGSLGALLDVSTVSQRRPVVMEQSMRRMQAVYMVSNEATQLTPNEIVIPASVVARWRFVPGR
jgi:uncharacterized protein YggE